MAKTQTKTAIAVELELPPTGGNISVVSTLEEDAHYLRVTLDKSENFRIAAGERLRDLLINKFGNNRNALRDWYEENVVQGKENRAWSTVVRYLGVVLKHGDEADSVLDQYFERKRTRDRDQQRDLRTSAGVRDSRTSENTNEINTTEQHSRPVKSEYDIRKEWLSDMNVLWFKGEKEWQDRWLDDRNLSRRRGFG